MTHSNVRQSLRTAALQEIDHTHGTHARMRTHAHTHTRAYTINIPSEGGAVCLVLIFVLNMQTQMLSSKYAAKFNKIMAGNLQTRISYLLTWCVKTKSDEFGCVSWPVLFGVDFVWFDCIVFYFLFFEIIVYLWYFM